MFENNKNRNTQAPHLSEKLGWAAIWALALPSIVSNITVPLLSLVDISIVGHIGGASYLAAISVGAMIFNVMYWVLSFLRMSISGLTAQAVGRGDTKAQTALFYDGMRLGLSLGVTIIVCCWLLHSAFMWAFQVNETEQALVSTYYYICVWGAPAVLATFALNGWLVGMQNTRILMRVAILQNVVNIILSVAFVFALNMGIAGVAMGTMLSQWLAFGLLLWESRRNFPDVARLKFVDIFLKKNEMKVEEASVANKNIFLRTLCLVAVNLYFTSSGSALGAEVLAANTLLMTFFTIFSYFMDGFAFAAEALGGMLCGAKRWVELRLLHRHLVVIGLVLVAVFTIAYGFGGELFLTLLTTDKEVIALASEYFHFVMLIPVAGVMAFIYDGLFIGLLRTGEMLLSTLVGAVAFFVIFLSLRGMLGNTALWWALLAYLFLRGVVLAYRWRIS